MLATGWREGKAFEMNTLLLAALAGFFSVEKTPEGRWWVKDAEGKRTIIRGVDWVIYRGHRCEADGTRHHYREWNDAHYASPAVWEKETLARLKDWGFNMLGTGADATLRHRGLAHAWEINFGNKFGTRDDWNDERWITPQEGRPCSALPNVFHPDFAAHCERMAQEVCAPMKNDRDLLGYFLDNELRWWGTGPWGWYTGVYTAVTNKPAAHSARKALAAFERAHPELKGEELQRGFLGHLAETYFRVTTAAVRKADPNHMILGCRFAGIGGADKVVWEAAGRYSDILTFNIYPEADLDRNVMRWSDGRLMTDDIAKVYGWAKRPVLITEWSFPALDAGLPSTNGAGQRFLTQKERAAATELCAKTFLSLPYLVGYDYFMWVDEPFNGISKAFPENSNYGLVSEKGVPYPEITDMFRRLHAEVEKWHDAPPPAEREPDPKTASWKPKGLWHGFNLLGLFRAPWNKKDARAQGFREEQFKWMAEWGFNFARLPMDYRNFVSTNDWSKVREKGYRDLDEAIAWGRRHRIHVQICLHRAPGFTIASWDAEPLKLQSDPVAQEAFVELWRKFAKRYRGIPNEELSFNLINEPSGFTKEQFTLVFGAAIRAIRAEDPDRFVMLDGNDTASQPVDTFFSVKSTGQAFRGYTPHAISHYGAWYIKDQPKSEPTWPVDPSLVDNRWIFEMPEKTLEKFDWVAKRGYPVMIGEFGCYNKISHETCLKWMEHCLKLWKERNLGWALWNLDGPFGILDSGRTDVDYEDFHGHKLDRKMLDLLLKYVR